mmetsp:Transcript_22703/g.74107  ORF Transcript_22703/g.74107 Transcript_22703/m.74107 type:complete len:350 (-) Transcript_22703:820-1869(-)
MRASRAEALHHPNVPPQRRHAQRGDAVPVRRVDGGASLEERLQRVDSASLGGDEERRDVELGDRRVHPRPSLQQQPADVGVAVLRSEVEGRGAAHRSASGRVDRRAPVEQCRNHLCAAGHGPLHQRSRARPPPWLVGDARLGGGEEQPHGGNLPPLRRPAQGEGVGGRARRQQRRHRLCEPSAPQPAFARHGGVQRRQCGGGALGGPVRPRAGGEQQAQHRQVASQGGVREGGGAVLVWKVRRRPEPQHLPHEIRVPLAAGDEERARSVDWHASREVGGRVCRQEARGDVRVLVLERGDERRCPLHRVELQRAVLEQQLRRRVVPVLHRHVQRGRAVRPLRVPGGVEAA